METISVAVAGTGDRKAARAELYRCVAQRIHELGDRSFDQQVTTFNLDASSVDTADVFGDEGELLFGFKSYVHVPTASCAMSALACAHWFGLLLPEVAPKALEPFSLKVTRIDPSPHVKFLPLRGDFVAVRQHGDEPVLVRDSGARSEASFRELERYEGREIEAVLASSCRCCVCSNKVGVDPTALFRASAADSAAAVGRALDSGIPVDSRRWDRTALIEAASQLRPRAVAALLAHRANVDAVSGSGQTALSTACLRQAVPKSYDPDGQKRSRVVSERLKVIDLLLEAGATRRITVWERGGAPRTILDAVRANVAEGTEWEHHVHDLEIRGIV